MNEDIDKDAVIAQLQIENEVLRSHMKAFTEVKLVVTSVPDMLKEMWHKLTVSKERLLVWVCVAYYLVAIVLQVYDRIVV